MVGPLWVLLIAAVVVAAASLLLVGQNARHRRAAFVRLADARGWDHRRHAPQDLVDLGGWFGIDDVAGHDYLAGPSAVGPFRLCTLTARGRRGGLALLHLRTLTSSPGLRIAPSPRFRLFRSPAGPARPGLQESFRRRYLVRSTDEAFTHAALDPDACALLLRPPVGLSLEWRGNDVLFLFPVAARNARGAETLIAFGTAVARRLDPQAPHASAGTRAVEGRPVPKPGVAVG